MGERVWFYNSLIDFFDRDFGALIYENNFSLKSGVKRIESMTRVEWNDMQKKPHVALKESIVMSAEQIGQQKEDVDDVEMLRREESYPSQNCL